MHLKTTRFIAWFLAVALCASFLALPVLAASEAEDGDPAGEEIFAEEVDPVPETPLVNVIDTGTPETPAAGEDPAPETPAEPELPAETEEPAGTDGTNEPGETDEPDAPAETDEPTGTDEPAETDEPGGSEEPASFTVSYYNGETLLAQETVLSGEAPVGAPASADGRPVKAWLDESGAIVTLSALRVEGDLTLRAWFAPQLKTAAHDRYINGIGNNKFSPATALTRAQAATILYQLLDSTTPGPFNNQFSDVSSSAWYAAAVTTLASFGVLNGYTDGTFRPDRAVTRAEFVTMLVNLTGVTGTTASFTDTGGHWALNAIRAAAGQGWINGYAQSDGTYTFRPDNSITRAEAVVVMNRVLGRSADANALATAVGLQQYTDVVSTDWWYGDVMEASIAHTYTRTSAGEVWTDYALDPSLTPGLQKVGSAYIYVDSSNKPVYVKAGINQVYGKYYYAARAGYSIDADLSSKSGYAVFANGNADQALANGFNLLGSTLFYWVSSQNAPMALTQGLNTIAGKTYWAEENGYNIRNDFGRGVVVLGEKNYLSDGACAIITAGEGYTKATSAPTTIDLKNQTYEFDGNMYYLTSDYSLASDAWVGYLYFGTDCRYTSSDATLDGYVYNVVKSFITNNALTKEQKLLKAYYYFRGGEGANWVDSGFKYMPASKGFEYGRYNGQQHYAWSIGCAKWMFSHKYGICYDWAAVLLYCAKRLGFQAYLCVGRIYYDIEADRHCWNVIEWDGKWHICDLNNEWGHLAGYYPTAKLYWNLFAQELSSQWVTTYRNPECGIRYYFK